MGSGNIRSIMYKRPYKDVCFSFGEVLMGLMVTSGYVATGCYLAYAYLTYRCCSMGLNVRYVGMDGRFLWTAGEEGVRWRGRVTMRQAYAEDATSEVDLKLKGRQSAQLYEFCRCLSRSRGAAAAAATYEHRYHQFQ